MALRTQLRIPGPTPVPEEVARAEIQPMINHRGPEFADILRRVETRLRWAFQTGNEIIVLTGSGTAGLEAAVVNFISPGERVLVCSCGSFGDRFSGIAKAYGADVVDLQVEWGHPIEAADVEAILSQDAGISTVFVTHNETSTGLTNPLAEICRVVKQHGKLLIVDGVSSVGSIDIQVDAWGIDVAVTGSQKGWMAPPGLAMLSVGGAAWEANARARCPRYYLDLAKARQFAKDGQTPWTPAVSVLYALDAGLAIMEREGLQEVFRRHQRVADAVRAGCEALGLRLYARDGFRSNTVTAVSNPEGVDGSQLTKLMRTKYGVVLSGGQGKLKGHIFRIGHLGLVDEGDALAVLFALEQALRDLDFAAPEGAGVAAAQRTLLQTAVPA
jgi:aspartate aminotransferase-like enzyme